MAVDGDVITCDKCHKSIGRPSRLGTSTAATLRSVAEENGWTAYLGEDLCKRCSGA